MTGIVEKNYGDALFELIIEEKADMLKAVRDELTQVNEILEQVPDLRVTYDQGNVATADDPLKAFELLRKYVVHFHVKDWYVSDEEKAGYDLKRCGKYYGDATIGEGDMDIRSFWQMTTAAERELFVNPETRDYTGKRAPLDIFRQVCAEMRSWEE